jgi:hypothetical protein
MSLAPLLNFLSFWICEGFHLFLFFVVYFINFTDLSYEILRNKQTPVKDTEEQKWEWQQELEAVTGVWFIYGPPSNFEFVWDRAAYPSWIRPISHEIYITFLSPRKNERENFHEKLQMGEINMGNGTHTSLDADVKWRIFPIEDRLSMSFHVWIMGIGNGSGLWNIFI